jgi:hypothetical protein
MRAVCRLIVLVFSVGLCGVIWVGPAFGMTAEDFQTNSVGLDRSDGQNGGWQSTIPGVLNRPYVKYLGVSNNGGAPVDVIVNTAPPGQATPTPVGGTDIYAFVAPVNACTIPTSRGCYETPNRVSVWIGHENGGGWSRDLTGSSPVVTENSTIYLTIGFRASYSTVGWSWANGIPSWWGPAVTSGTGGDIRIQFTPKTMPSSDGMPATCSTVPITSCDYVPTSADVFQPQLLVSMDNTLGPLFAGSLFATTSSALGSLDVPAASGFATNPDQTMSYQLAGPHTLLGGATRTGGLYAVIPSAVLSVFGTSSTSFDRSRIPVQRTGDAGSGDVTWTPWTVGANGIDAMLLNVTGISFSTPKFVVGRQSSNSGSGGNGGNGGSSGTSSPPSLKVGQKATFAQLLAVANVKTPAGAKITAKVSTPKVCKVIGKTIKGLAVGTCRGAMTITPKKGKPTKKAFTFKVTKTGKRLPLALHH